MANTGYARRFRPGQQGSTAVWLLTILLLLFAIATGYVWYKYATQSDLLSQRETELTNLELDFERLQRDLDDASSRTSTAERRISDLERQLQQLDTAQSQASDLQSQVNELKNNALTAATQLQDCQEQAKAAEAAKAELQTRITALEAKIKDEEANKAKLEAAIEELKQAEDMGSDAASLQKQVVDLKKRLGSCQEKLDALQLDAKAREKADAAVSNAARQVPDIVVTQQDAAKPAGPSKEELAAQAEAQIKDCEALAEELEALRAKGEPADATRIGELENSLQQCHSRAETLQEHYKAEKQMAEAYQDMIESLRQEIHDKDVRIKRIQNRLEIDILGHILFKTASTRITPQGQELLGRIMPSLQSIEDRQLYIVGHTDDRKIAPNFRRKIPSNWELSAGRAASVVRYLIDNANIPPSHLAAVGVADTQPEASNDTSEGRAKNRRVEIIVGAPILGKTN